MKILTGWRSFVGPIWSHSSDEGREKPHGRGPNFMVSCWGL